MTYRYSPEPAYSRPSVKPTGLTPVSCNFYKVAGPEERGVSQLTERARFRAPPDAAATQLSAVAQSNFIRYRTYS